jgi:ABC-2 type transport system permease protein
MTETATQVINQTTNYKSTLMQRLLGRNYKWWYLVKYEFMLGYTNRLNILITVVRYLIPLVISYIIYSVIGNSRSLSEYLILASFLYQFYAFTIGPSYDITNGVIKGDFTKYLIRPTNYFVHLVARIFGFNIIPLIARIGVFAGLILLLGIKINFGMNFFMAIGLLLIGIISGFLLEIINGSFVFYQYELNKTYLPFFYDLMPFLTGSLIPLSLITFLPALIYLPFAFIIFHPMQIYLGKYDFNQTLMVFAGGITWCVVLYFLAKLIFRMGLKRNEAVGL